MNLGKLDAALAACDGLSKREIKWSGESGLANLKTIHEMAQEERQLNGNHAANAVWVRNKGDVQRWVRQMKDAGMEVPKFVLDNRSLVGL